MKATEGNGGPGIVLGKEPVESPQIPRGATLVPLALFDPVPAVGDRITFRWVRGLFALTFHAIEVMALEGSDVRTYVRPSDVVTWDRLSG